MIGSVEVLGIGNKIRDVSVYISLGTERTKLLGETRPLSYEPLRFPSYVA